MNALLAWLLRDDSPYLYEFLLVGRYEANQKALHCGGLLPRWPIRDSNPCPSLERAISWAARRMGLGTGEILSGRGRFVKFTTVQPRGRATARLCA